MSVYIVISYFLINYICQLALASLYWAQKVKEIVFGLNHRLFDSFAILFAFNYNVFDSYHYSKSVDQVTIIYELASRL